MRLIWERYLKRKSRAGIVIDFSVLVIVLLLLVPPVRMAVMVQCIRATLLKPKAVAELQYITLPQDVVFRTQEGGSVLLPQKLERPLLINVGAVWSAQSRAELKSLNSFAERYRGAVDVVFVTDCGVEETQQYMQSRGYTLRCLYLDDVPDEAEEASDAFFLSLLNSVPSSIMIGTDGRVLIKKYGAAHWKGRKVDELIKNQFKIFTK